jgi:hypothetical protein
MAMDQADVTKPLKDFMDVQLMAQIYIGSNMQPFDVIFDTGSNMMWINSRVCTVCSNAKFDER